MTLPDYTLEVGGHDVTEDVLVGRASVTWSRGLDQMRVLSPPQAGEMSARLKNVDGDYLPDGATPLRPGDAAVLEAEYDGDTYPLFAGVLERPQQQGPEWRETVGLQAFGTLSRLTDKRGLSTALYQDIRTDEAIAVVLELCGLTPSDYELDAGLTTLRWWWLDGEDAFGALRALVASEGPGAMIYEDAAGRVVFRNRHSLWLDARSVSAQGDYGPGGLPLTAPWEYDDGLSEVVNVCTVLWRRREAAALGVAWELGESLTLAPGESRTVEASARSDAGGRDPLMDAVAPSEGGGDFVVSAGGIASVSLDRTSGARIAITLTAGAGGATVDELRLRAKRVGIASEAEVSNTVDTSASQAAHGVQSYPLEVRPEMDLLTAQDFANAVVGFYAAGRPQLRFSTYSRDASALEALLEREIGDRVHAEIPRLDVDGDFTVLYREDSVRQGVHEVTFGCEAALGLSNPFRADISVADGPDKAWF